MPGRGLPNRCVAVGIIATACLLFRPVLLQLLAGLCAVLAEEVGSVMMTVFEGEFKRRVSRAVCGHYFCPFREQEVSHFVATILSRPVQRSPFLAVSNVDIHAFLQSHCDDITMSLLGCQMQKRPTAFIMRVKISAFG